MADHAELAAELDHVEKMSTQERLKHARKRRQHQLKKYLQYDKQQEKDNKKKPKKRGKDAAAAAENNKKNKRNVQFITSVMLLDAAARNDVKEVRELLKKGVSPNVANEDGLTALHQCCIDDYENMMKALIEFGANVNATDTEQWTPLHAAATCGHVHLCKYLIDHGAELLAVNADGNMPYDICEDEVTLDFIETEMSVRGITQEMIDETRLLTEKAMLADMQTLLREQGNFDFRDKHGASVLHIATANGYVDVVEYLLKNHHPVDLRDNDEWQPVHAAACWGHLNILESLVQHGADLDARTKNGETPADICEDLEIQRRIIELKEEVRTHRTTRGSVEHRHRRSNNPRSSIGNSASSLYNSNNSLSAGPSPFSTRRESLTNANKSPGRDSASVRRTSMREKNAISRKEAREEARIRDSVASDDGILMPTSNIDDVKLDIPETEELTVSPTTITSDQTPTVTSNKPHQNGSSTHDAAAFTSSSAENIIQHPLTNISGYDDPQPPTSHSDPHRPPTADVTNVTPTPPPTSVTDHQEHPVSSTQRVRPPSPQRHQQHHQPEPAVAVNRTEPPVQPPPTAVTVEPTPPPTLAPVSAKKPKPADRQIAPVKPQPQERKDKPNVGVRTENNNDKANKPNASNAENTKRPGERQQREEKAQRRKNNVDVINAMGNSSEIAVVAPQQQPKKETNNREQPSPARSTGYDNQISKIKQHPPMNDMTHLTWNPSTMPPTGTLADLKNQRNRMREQSHRSGSIDHGHSGSNGKLANSSADLHDSGSIGGNQPQHNGSHSPASSTVLYGHDGTSTTSLEPPRRVFHANEVIGAEEKKGCCVIL